MPSLMATRRSVTSAPPSLAPGILPKSPVPTFAARLRSATSAARGDRPLDQSQPDQLGVVGNLLTVGTRQHVFQPDPGREAEQTGVHHEWPAAVARAVQQYRRGCACRAELRQDL